MIAEAGAQSHANVKWVEFTTHRVDTHDEYDSEEWMLSL